MNKTAKSILVVVILILVAWIVSSASDSQAKAIKLGAILALTGSGADQGEWVKRGIELALDEAGDRSAVPIEVIYEDSAGDPKLAISAYNKLRSEHKIPVVFTWGSGVGIALTPLVNQDKVIQMGVATAANAYSTPNDFTFRIFPRADEEAAFLANATLNQLAVNKIAILRINNDYGQGSADAFKKFYEESGGEVVAEDVFAPGASDFRTQLTKLKTTSPKLIYLATYPKEGGLLLRQAKEFGIKSDFIASVAILGGKDFFNTAGESADGLIVVTSVPELVSSQDNAVQDFVSHYREKYQETLGAQHLYTARAYDAMKIVVAAIYSCGKKIDIDTECLRDHLYGVRDYPGVSGTISFDRNGDVSSLFNLQRIRGGKFVEYKI